MKKIAISIILIIMYFICFFKVEAVGNVNLSASKTVVNIGDTFTVSINLSGASVATLTARVSFDTSKVDYVSGPSNSNLSGGRVIYTWTDPTGGTSPLTGGTIATFTFRAKAEGNVSFSVSGNFFTPEETSVNPSFSGVSVSIKKVETTTPDENTGTGTGTGTGAGTGGENSGGTNAGAGNGTGTGTNTGSGGTQTGTGGTQTGGNQTGTGSTTGSNGNNTGTSGGNNTGSSGNTTGGIVGGNTGTTTNPPINNNIGTGNNINNNQQTTKSANNNLKSLQIDTEGISPAFNKNQTQYYLTIEESVSNINVTAIPEDSKASVQILGNNNIQVGNSQIRIIVTAENGYKKEYIINVVKTNNFELTNANLENLAIEDVTLVPEFNPNVTDYTAEISGDIDKLNILAVPQIEGAKVTIDGNENLQIGDNYIKITVLAQDEKTSKIYNVNVKKIENLGEEENIDNKFENNEENSEENNLNGENIENAIKNKVENNNILLVIGLICLSILAVIITIILVKKKKNKDRDLN